VQSTNYYSIEEVIEYMDVNFPNGSYLKDVNNKLDAFVGTWKGVYGDKMF
jgi:hypothetical protein